ncbi:uncharacterized protein MAM_02949 [Metarhizium album ARSEF 1941]|uniref:Uncharacterized protein n=1 Tax=Metarhizium album (strain ARSEF 1941) TaxID=1081103 RepID=A0A0B2WT87_METAS|nr:uncharacterized protein MAM_02949 [Metarhizium album ARSEF 1941]KHN99251.1 hypothetical protein MAM_02949 [Metarhizium album ARSEF 1941]
MLPPVDEQVLRENPEFAKLYSILKNDILNPDGSTKNDPDANERKAVSQELNKIRRRCAKQYLLQQAIASASPPDDSISADKAAETRVETPPLAEPSTLLTDLLLILPSLVDSDELVDSDAAALVLSSPPFSEFESLLPQLGAIISANLHASALGLVRITHPHKNPSYLHRHIPFLAADHAALRDKLSEAQLSLMSNRVQALASLTELISSCTQFLTIAIQTLESKHGVAARSLELRALDVSLEAQSMELDATAESTKLSKEIYSPEAVTALRHYLSHLKDAQVRAAERVRGLQAELGEYGVGVSKDGSKEKTMKELAREYREMQIQVEDVKRDLERLNNESK